MALVALQKTMDALRYDGADNAPVVQQAIDDASAAVLSHLKLPSTAYQDSNGDVVDVPEDIQRATIFLAGYFLRDPSGVEGKDLDEWSLPRPVLALLYPHRRPTYA